MKLNDKAYDILKYIVIIFLPALGIAYTGLSAIWNLPFSSQIPSTLDVIQVFCASCLLISNAEYNKGLKLNA